MLKGIGLSSTNYFIMKNPNKRQLNKTAFNNSSDIDFMKLYRRCTPKPYLFLVIDATLASENPLRFRKKLSESIWKDISIVFMTNDDQVRDGKL